MTTKTTMPGPVAWVRRQDAVISTVRKQSGAWLPMVTTAQAEAYAQAKMQELSDAAKALADWAEHEVGACPELTPGVAEIRALIPKEPPCET